MSTPNSVDKEWSPNIEQEILRAVRSLRYGSVEIIIHDSKVVQIERKEDTFIMRRVRLIFELPRDVMAASRFQLGRPRVNSSRSRAW